MGFGSFSYGFRMVLGRWEPSCSPFEAPVLDKEPGDPEVWTPHGPGVHEAAAAQEMRHDNRFRSEGVNLVRLWGEMWNMKSKGNGDENE